MPGQMQSHLIVWVIEMALPGDVPNFTSTSVFTDNRVGGGVIDVSDCAAAHTDFLHDEDGH